MAFNPLLTPSMVTAPKLEEPAPDWDERHLADSLDAEGWALLPGLLAPDDCATLAGLYDAPQHFRSRIVMARHGFGRGEYQYFAYPLPPAIERLRHALYPPLARIANAWQARLGSPTRYPAELGEFLARCHRAGQIRPTPLLLRYGAGDHNCLHQDLYGEHVFPLQLAILLSAPGRDFCGGEFLMTERTSDGQRADVVPLRQGDGVVFTVNERPVPGRRGGWRRAQLRHGVSAVRVGQRHTVGVIFHDAR